jgi:hypothetical protein
MVETYEQAEEAFLAAREAAEKARDEAIEAGAHWFPCGFAWVHVADKGNSKRMRLLKAAAAANGERMDTDYPKGWMLFWGGTHGGQEMEVKAAACRAAANVLREYGFDAYAQSRMD